MAKVLITGASGFIGSHLTEMLVGRGEEVRCLVRRSTSQQRKERLVRLGGRLSYGDVRDPESLDGAVEGVTCVYHLAGRVKAFSREEFLSVNEAGVENVARACARQTSPPVLIVVSSLAAAGPSAPGHLRTEEEPAPPVSDYGHSKRAGELAAMRLAADVPTTIVRPPIVLGGGDTDGLLMFRSIVRFGTLMVPGNTSHRYSVVHASDLATGLILAGDRGQRLPVMNPATDDTTGDPDANGQGIYFTAADEQPTFAELGQRIGEAVGRSRVRVVRVPLPMLRVAAAVSGTVGRLRATPSILNSDKCREAAAGSWACCSERIRSELGFAPAMPLADRLRQTYEWYVREGWL